MWHFVERARSVDSDGGEMQKAIQIKNAKPPEAQPLLPPYEKSQSETWHTLSWITGENAFYQKNDYSTS